MTSASEFLRRLKLVYWINNLFNWKYLRPNKALYRKYGIKKSVFAPISSADFPDKAEELPWLDQPGALQRIEKNSTFLSFDTELQQAIRTWITDGYLILEQFFSPEDVDLINSEVDRLCETRELTWRGNRIIFAIHHSEKLKKAAAPAKLMQLLDFILGKEAVLFQSLNFLKGSEQRAHSDSIHMTTYPAGYLCASWLALEDVGQEQGNLFYYPGSHKFEYLMNQDFETGDNAFLLGKGAYDRYEDKIESVIQEKQLTKREFYPKKGDMLIWHANLIHGGNLMKDQSLTRKSMVLHFYAKDVICYHELTRRPAIIK